MKKEVVAYTRQSLQKQERESSTGSQWAAIKEYAKEKRQNITLHFTDTGTGKHMRRQGIQDLIRRIKADSVDAVMVWRIDRISRRTSDLLNFLMLCETHNVTIESVNDNVLSNHNAMDKFKVQTLAIIAELQRNIISENKQNGLHAKFQKGQPISTAAPFGYRYQDGEFHILPEEAETVRAVFDLYLDGKGYKKISQITNERRDLIFRTPQQVRYILKNEKSTGQYVGKHGRLADIVPPIITRETFKAAKKIRLSKQNKTSQPVSAKLRRKIQCPVCNGTMTPFHNRGQINSTPFYVCATRMQHQYKDCSMSAIPIRKIEHQVLQAVIQFVTTKDQLTETHIEIMSRIKQKQQLSQQHFNQVQRQKNNLISSLADGHLSMDEFKSQISKLSLNSESVAGELNLKAVTLEKLIQLIESHPKITEALWPLIENVHITKEGEVNAIHIKGFEHNIITHTLKEQMINEYCTEQAAD